MTFEEFEKAKPRELRAKAKSYFEAAQAPGHTGERVTSFLLEAQFYMGEIDRRHDSWISLRDLVLEIVVILLIGWEIFEGNKQASVLDKQLTVLNT